MSVTITCYMMSHTLSRDVTPQVLSVFDALVNIELKKKMCKETLGWAVSCGQRHYAGRSFEVRKTCAAQL